MTGVDTTGAHHMHDTWIQKMRDSTRSLAAGLINTLRIDTKDKSSLPHIEICIYNSTDTFKTQTDIDGHFLIQTLPGEYSASFSFGAIVTYEAPISLKQGMLTSLVVGLDLINKSDHTISLQYENLNEINIDEIRTRTY